MSKRAPSPTSTTFSGISNYRSDNYKPTRDKPGGSQIPAVPSMDSRATARAHYDELQKFLASHLAKEPLNSRSSAREKLTRLTKQQFQELSTDVYDELMRRNTNSEQNEVPFLPVREDFHPKRNQARQKLATLPATRFKDLSSDVFYELGRRYPEFKEPEVPPATPGSEYTESDDPKNRSTPDKDRSANTPSGRKPSQDTFQQDTSSPRRQMSRDAMPSGRNLSQSEDTVRSFARKPSLDQSNGGHYRRPSQPGRQQSQDDGYGGSGGSGGSAPGFPSSATSGVVIPNKSTIAEEEIEVPYGKDDELSSGSDMQPNGRVQNTTSALATKNKRVISTGLGALGSALLNAPLSPTSEDDPTLNSGADRRGQSELYETLSYGRASVASATSVGYRGGREEREEAEKMRSEYEFKIATMQNRIGTMDSELRGAKDALAEYDDRVRSMTEELNALRSRAEEQSNAMRSLQKELDEARSMRRSDSMSRGKEQDRSDAQVRALQERIQTLEQERYNNQNSSGVNGSEVAGLRQEMQSLLDELRDLSSRNDELTAEKDADQASIYNLTTQVKDYKRKYEHAKTELRNYKATSQLFHPQTPRSDDQLPIAEHGGILDIHVTSFQSAVDGLLSTARSSQPSSVFTPMKAVVTAVSTITDDIRNFEQRPQPQRRGIEDETLRSLRERADATLSNLVAASKSHALANGMSPVSLMDAAASHVSAVVVDICKTVMMRKSTVADRERERQAAASSPLSRLGGLGGLAGRSSPGSKTLEELKGAERLHGRTPSDSSQWSNTNGAGTQRFAGGVSSKTKMTMSDRSSNSSPQPPMIFDKGAGTSDEDGVDEAWDELKPYLDAQSEAIVIPIRNLLSAIRAGAEVSELNDNLTQIITIVTSIVAVCKDALPAASVSQGKELLAQLDDNCNKLSELQGMSEITKQTRQAMASSSFAVAKAMKELRAL